VSLKHTVIVEIPDSENITLELDDALAPKTVAAVLKYIPFTIKANIWGKEIYTDPAPFSVGPENAHDIVELYDVAFWPPGNAICLFYGNTPLSDSVIKPYSPVNVIGKILHPNTSVIKKALDKKLVFHT
jgi:uncharacterized protein